MRVRVIRGLTPSICRIHQGRNRTRSLFVFDLKMPLGDQKYNMKFDFMEVDLIKLNSAVEPEEGTYP